MFIGDIAYVASLAAEYLSIKDRLDRIEAARTVEELVDLITESASFEELKGTPLKARKAVLEAELVAFGVTLEAPAPTPVPVDPVDVVPV